MTELSVPDIAMVVMPFLGPTDDPLAGCALELTPSLTSNLPGGSENMHLFSMF